jgi:putative membrane protein
MNTDKKTWISDRNFFWLVTGISVAVLAVVVLLRYLPDAYRPNVLFARNLPFVNACINSAVSVLILLGYHQIRYAKNKARHQFFMLAAFILSGLFLVSYVVYHTTMPHTPFCTKGWIKTLYFFILSTHIFLAAIILPIILYTIYFSTNGMYARHKKLARWTFPLWLYVSVTGVVVYLLISPCYKF